MNKESLIAIVLGLVLGVGVAFVAVYVTVQTQKQENTALQNSNTSASGSAILQPSIIPTVVVQQPLEITSPHSGSITQEKNILIKGSAGKHAVVIVQSPIKTLVQYAQNDTFSIDFPLALGENVISVSAYHEGAVVPVQKKLYIYRLIP